VPLTDGQTIAAMAATAGLISAGMGYLQNRFGKKVDRQTSIESNLLAQTTECNKRVDVLQKMILDMEVAHRSEIAKTAAEVRAEVHEYRAEIDLLEEEIRHLREKMRALEDEYHRYKLAQIGSMEKVAPRKERPGEPQS